MAINPVNGKSFHGCSSIFVKLSKASGKTCMNPVDRITPAANAFTMKKRLLSGLNAGNLLAATGRHTPAAPATRIDASAAALYLSARVLFRSSFSGSLVQLPRTTAGSKKITAKKIFFI
ncbi:hypothetical protein C2S51_037699 [Perilla frutescens var. frutescens]|nr:hypothetical protein C2S51_037699 [Perilla frutescens var. frutescens]